MRNFLFCCAFPFREELYGLVDGHFEHIENVFAPILNFENIIFKAFSMAAFTN